MPTRKYWDKVNATQKAMMRNMKASRILEVQSNGDLTFEAEGRQYILTTNGELSPGTPTYRPDRPGPMPQRLPATKKAGSFVIGHDHMGNLIITHTERTGEVFLQFESDRQVVYDLLKKWELKEVEKGYSVQVKGAEPRASILDELWDVTRPQSLPQTMPERGMDYYKVPPDAY